VKFFEPIFSDTLAFAGSFWIAPPLGVLVAVDVPDEPLAPDEPDDPEELSLLLPQAARPAPEASNTAISAGSALMARSGTSSW
jgi:hypothetical protein